MADTKLLYTLSRCVEAGYAEAVNLAVTRFDPLQRRGLKRAVHEAMASVANATHLSPEGAGETHHLRLALLASAGQLQSVNGDDAEGVAAAARTIVAAHPARRGRAFWPITYAIASLLLVSGLAALAVILWPTPEERFRTSAFGEALGEPLTQFVVKAGRGKGAANEPRAELLSFGVRRQLGDEATRLLEEVLTLTVDASEAQTDADTKAAITQLDQSARKLNQQLEARRIPALVDPYAFESGNQGGAAVYLLGYFVEDRALVDYAKEAPRRVFWARRLDRLNLKAGLYVYPSKSADAVILSLDDLQQSILSSDVDTLGKGRPFKLGGAASDSPAAMKLGQLVRDELLFASKLSDVEADDIASLMAKRRSVFERLALKGWNTPSTLLLYPRDESRLRALSDDVDAKEAVHLNEKLADYLRQFSRIVDAFAVVEEERAIARLAPGPAQKLKATGFDITAYTAAELGILARGRALPSTTLASLARTALSGVSTQELGAIAALRAISTELGIKSSPWEKQREGDAEAVDEIEETAFGPFMMELAGRSTKDVAGAAARAYQRLFQEPVPEYSRSKIAR